MMVFLNIIIAVFFAQTPPEGVKADSSNVNVLERVIVDGDTIYVSTIEEAYIYPKKTFKNRWQEWRYNRLVKNVKKVYPYSVIAKERLKELNDTLQYFDTRKQQKEYINSVEDELFKDYEDELKKLTISQGKILIKLIDRQTGDTSYELLKDVKGNMSAFFWQAIARLFGSNLKMEYDADGEDQDIEKIVRAIEKGYM
jgi:hypothetical protein